MGIEKFANKASTTLASSYTAGDPTILVASAADFPTVGDFRVVLGNTPRTVLLVTAVSGTTFTVQLEEDDGNASAGLAVDLVATKAVAERFLQHPDGVEIGAPAASGGLRYWGPMRELVQPDTSAWTWVNQGSQGSFVQTARISQFKVVAAGGTNARVFKKTAPATPYTVTVMFDTLTFRVDNNHIGLAFRESGTGKIVLFGVLSNLASLVLRVAKYNSAISFNSNAASSGFLAFGLTFWLRLADDGTNITFSYSIDGENFEQLFTELRGAFFTTAPDEFGFAGDIGGADSSISAYSFVEA